jgi:hypothetical protein
VSRALTQVLELEVRSEIATGLAATSNRLTERLQPRRGALARLRADLERAATRLLDQARDTLRPPVPTDTPALALEVLIDWVTAQFGTADGPLPSPLSATDRNLAPVPWTEWDAERLERALTTLAARQVEANRRVLEHPALREGDELIALGDLVGLSQPLVPVLPSAFDSHPHQVFQQSFVPLSPTPVARPGVTLLDLADGPRPAWPTVVTVYRNLPISALEVE